MTQQSVVSQGLLITEASRWRLDTPHSVGLTWTSDVPHNTHETLTTNRHPCPRRDSDPQSQQVRGPWLTLRPLGSALRIHYTLLYETGYTRNL